MGCEGLRASARSGPPSGEDANGRRPARDQGLRGTPDQGPPPLVERGSFQPREGSETRCGQLLIESLNFLSLMNELRLVHAIGDRKAARVIRARAIAGTACSRSLSHVANGGSPVAVHGMHLKVRSN